MLAMPKTPSESCQNGLVLDRKRADVPAGDHGTPERCMVTADSSGNLGAAASAVQAVRVNADINPTFLYLANQSTAHETA